MSSVIAAAERIHRGMDTSVDTIVVGVKWPAGQVPVVQATANDEASVRRVTGKFPDLAAPAACHGAGPGGDPPAPATALRCARYFSRPPLRGIFRHTTESARSMWTAISLFVNYIARQRDISARSSSVSGRRSSPTDLSNNHQVRQDRQRKRSPTGRHRHLREDQARPNSPIAFTPCDQAG
jgi:hypothetical protein